MTMCETFIPMYGICFLDYIVEIIVGLHLMVFFLCFVIEKRDSSPNIKEEKKDE